MSIDLATTASNHTTYDVDARSETRSRNESEKLPVELLIKIFSYASGLSEGYNMDVESASYYVSKLHTVARVCRRWLDIIKGAPELWTLVTDRDPANATLALDKSGLHPFSLALTSTPLNTPLYDKVLSHSRRWRRADIRVVPGDEKALRRLEEISTPLLQHLQIECPRWGRNSALSVDLFRDHPPKLASLALINITIHPWNSPIFGSHLHTLKLTRIHTSGPTRENLYGILLACPALAHLELINVAFSGEAGDWRPQIPSLQLPLLHTLRLRPSSPFDALDVARMAEIPRCRYYYVSNGPENPHSIVLTAVALQVQKPLEACIASGRSLDVQIDGYWICLFCRDKSPSSSFNLKLGKISSYEQVFDWINTILLVPRPPRSPIPVSIHLEYPRNRGPPPSPSDLFRIPNVWSLTISDNFGYTHTLVEALSGRSDLGNGSDGWPWPRLQRVAIKAFHGPSTALLYMIKARMEAALHKEGTRCIGGIAKLDRFHVEAGVFMSEEFEAIRGVLGDAAIVKPANS
ncbi:hypothetical protein FRB95_012081 [Tulasnella sp. JGI-2019a]|nr:hypothetical protein FRB95_012081 [Tulasnella sp. JGI-2019a]